MSNRSNVRTCSRFYYSFFPRYTRASGPITHRSTPGGRGCQSERRPRCNISIIVKCHLGGYFPADTSTHLPPFPSKKTRWSTNQSPGSLWTDPIKTQTHYSPGQSQSWVIMEQINHNPHPFPDAPPLAPEAEWRGFVLTGHTCPYTTNMAFRLLLIRAMHHTPHPQARWDSF